MYSRRILRFTNALNGEYFNVRRYFKCLDSALKETVDKRNIGIIAHIDAGKTTTTEQLLYLSGLTSSVGDVDNGNTITDYMDLERERGITIQSAAVTCIWRNHRINIIDTPGHVDFTLEVERSLRVMDGTVTILDGATGVQAQTLTVWRQAGKFELPTVFFINKMDKPLADFEMCIKSVENRLGHSVLPVVIPIKTAGKFAGLVNILNRTYLDMSKSGSDAAWSPIDKSSREHELCEKYWENLISGLGDADESFASRLLSDQPIPSDEVVAALRSLTLKRALSPLACGTALRCTNTVTPILDMIVDFLPGPHHRSENIPHSNGCALVFKIGHDKEHGRLDYARVYKGKIIQGSKLLNANLSIHEAGVKLYTPYSDTLHPVQQADEGDVVVMTGLKSTVTGDTLLDDSNLKHVKPLDLKDYILQGIESPEPVFSCSIEPPSTTAIHKFESALAELCIEDPSLRVTKDEETGQNILQGMGELHIEVIKERLKREYGLNVFIGKLRVGYRELLSRPTITHSVFKEDAFGEKKRIQWCSIQLKLDLDLSKTKFEKVIPDIENAEERDGISNDSIKYINDGCRMALYNGPLLGFPVNNLSIYLKSFSASGNSINSALISAAAGSCVKEALQLAGTELIEPIMRFEITLFPAGADAIPSRETYNSVIHELTHRRAEINDEIDNEHLTFIYATIPLCETAGLSSKMRELSSGLCTLHMEVAEYQRMSPEAQQSVIENHRRNASM